MSVRSFYDQMAPFYHLIYPDWESSIERQANMLHAVIRDRWGDALLPDDDTSGSEASEPDASILDAACGIGTQALGLARIGYQVTASDLSPGEVRRARSEAERRGLSISFSVADMREAYVHHRRSFDLVIACDNAVPHLLSDADILVALRQFYRCTRSGGGCLISVRDYEQMERRDQVQLYGIREEDGVRTLIFQARRFQGAIYDLDMYFVEDAGGSECTAHVMRTRYYAVSTTVLEELMRRAGFVDVQRLDGVFFQPLLVGTRP
jgi:SAM-dependent methyltransferase